MDTAHPNVDDCSLGKRWSLGYQNISGTPSHYPIALYFFGYLCIWGTPLQVSLSLKCGQFQVLKSLQRSHGGPRSHRDFMGFLSCVYFSSFFLTYILKP